VTIALQPEEARMRRSLSTLLRVTTAAEQAWTDVANWMKPFLVAFSDPDLMTAPYAESLRAAAPGAKQQTVVTIKDAGYYVQDDSPDVFAAEVLAFIERTS
jgi:pimeloyl-ACP methyl ester carboxylesterase